MNNFKDEFQKNGIAVIENWITEDECKMYIQEMDKILDGFSFENYLNKTNGKEPKLVLSHQTFRGNVGNYSFMNIIFLIILSHLLLLTMVTMSSEHLTFLRVQTTSATFGRKVP